MKKRLRRAMVALAWLISTIFTILVCAGFAVAVASAAFGIWRGFELSYGYVGWPGPLALGVFLFTMAYSIAEAYREMVTEDKKR